ncbi:MAG: GTPase [Maribacter sp.]
MPGKLLFIYNANSDNGSQLLDFAHKMLSPATYDCNLCSLTFGRFTEKRQWKVFRKKLKSDGHALSFLHKDEFQNRYKSKFGHAFTFPIILMETDYDLEVLVSAESLDKMGTLEELIAKIQFSLEGI